jgi:hypothetical protein
MTNRTVTVGVTGHRRLADLDDVRERVRAALDHAAGPVANPIDGAGAGTIAGTGVASVELWTSLAEGADRIVATAVTDRGGRVVVVLPFPADEYRHDFPETVSEFDGLLDAADRTVVMPGDPADRPAAYEAAGRFVVESTDVLVALWDGLPSRGRGGTAEVIAHARALGRRVIVVPVTRVGDRAHGAGGQQ